jgi:hypothetical protein
MLNRRTLLRSTLAALAASQTGRRAWAAERTPAVAVEQAQAEIWRRFIDQHGVMIDFTALDGSVDLPTPEECREGKPNALGWFQPIENGAMFNGMYLDAAVNCWRLTRRDEAAARARRLMEGLLFLASISDVRGFVARGVSTDGKSHYPMGSNDQTLPWFYGLWIYLTFGPVTAVERERIVAKLVEVAEVIVGLDWKMPAEPPFDTRGTFLGYSFDTATRQLFVMKLMHAATGEAKWDAMYRATLPERGGKENRSKREICEHGMVYEYAKTHAWTSCCSVAALRGLWELEQDGRLREAFATGLEASAKLAAECLPLAERFDANHPSTFNTDWRTPMMPLWRPQQTEHEAQDLAQRQLIEFAKLSPRRNQEVAFVREPAPATWIITLCPDVATVRQYAPAIERVITRYDYSQLYYSQFFWVESAWWRLREMGLAG